MEENLKKESELTPFETSKFPPTDESGEVDLSMIDSMLSLTPAQRLRWHAEMMEFIDLQRQLRIQHYGFDPAAD